MDSPLRGRENFAHARGAIFALLGQVLVLALIGVSCFAVRVAALKVWGTGVIEHDGAEFARIAENLRQGIGYVGLVTPGRELNYPPLFPLLISGVSLVTRDYEQAGRLISLVFGTLLVLPMFGVASRLFGQRTAFVAAILTILHPLLISLSSTVWSEGPYVTLLLSATYLVLRALHDPAVSVWALAGGAFGLAYLVRPEAVFPLLIAVLFAFARTSGTLATRWKCAGAVMIFFLALALPQIVFIYRSTGKIRLDGKSAIVFAIGSRILSAQASTGTDRKLASSPDGEPSTEPNLESWQPWEEKWATSAINDNLEGTGVWMRSNADVIRDGITLKELGRILRKSIRHNVPELFRGLSARWFGTPFLLPLALLGICRRPWPRRLTASHLFVMLVPLTSAATTFATLWTYPRFYFVLVPFLLVWAANGLVVVGRWVKVSLAAAGWRWFYPEVASCIIPALLGIAMVTYPIKEVRNLYEFTLGSPSGEYMKEVGLWIGRQQDHTVTIMDLTVTLAFYAHAQFVAFPYCSGALALRYLDAAKVDYVVLRRQERYTQYYTDWLMNGLPDPRAQLVQVFPGTNAGDIMVYRWHRSEGSTQAPQH